MVSTLRKQLSYISLVIASIILSSFSIVGIVYAYPDKSAFQLGAFQFNKDTFKEEITSFHDGMQGLHLAAHWTFLASSVYIIIVGAVFFHLFANEKAIKGLSFAMMIPALAMVILAICYGAIQNNLLNSAANSMQTKALENPAVKKSIEDAYKCEMGTDCKDKALGSWWQYSFLSASSSGITAFGFSYMLAYLVSSPFVKSSGD